MNAALTGPSFWLWLSAATSQLFGSLWAVWTEDRGLWKPSGSRKQEAGENERPQKGP